MKNFRGVIAAAIVALAACAYSTQGDGSTYTTLDTKTVTGYPNGVAMQNGKGWAYNKTYPTLKTATQVPTVFAGSRSVTGSATFSVGLTTVRSVTATIADDPSLTATLVTAPSVATATTGWNTGAVTLVVWKPTSSSVTTPTTATVATNVNWVASGD